MAAGTDASGGFSTLTLGSSRKMGEKPPGSTGAFALKNTKMHPTLRLDQYLREADPSYKPSPPTLGESFVRRMNTYGGVRPSVAFTNEGREARHFKGSGSSFGMSNLPPTFYDPTGDTKREYSYALPTFNEVDTSHVKMFTNQDLMMPSERQKEHQAMKQGIEQWRRARAELFEHKKRKRLLERQHKSGVTSLDGPLFENTELYAEHRQIMQTQAEIADRHGFGRMEHLAMQSHVDDATGSRYYGTPYEPPVRSAEIPLQRKKVDPQEHPFRFMNTHERLWPKHEPQWDPERAKILRHHDVRHKSYNIINQADNTIEGIRVRVDPGVVDPSDSPA